MPDACCREPALNVEFECYNLSAIIDLISVPTLLFKGDDFQICPMLRTNMWSDSEGE
jgi:hypothetical protein